MKFKIKYLKTKHFIYRQKERNVKEELLLFVFNKIENPMGKKLLVISRKIVRKYYSENKEELFLKVDGNVLITCFFGDFQGHMFSKKKETYYIIN